MKNLIVLVLFLDVYAIVYYRLLVRWHYEQQSGARESALGVLFSFPPYTVLADRGRQYVRRYWFAVAIMVLCVAMLVHLTEFGTAHVSPG